MEFNKADIKTIWRNKAESEKNEDRPHDVAWYIFSASGKEKRKPYFTRLIFQLWAVSGAVSIPS